MDDDLFDPTTAGAGTRAPRVTWLDIAVLVCAVLALVLLAVVR